MNWNGPGSCIFVFVFWLVLQFKILRSSCMQFSTPASCDFQLLSDQRQLAERVQNWIAIEMRWTRWSTLRMKSEFKIKWNKKVASHAIHLDFAFDCCFQLSPYKPITIDLNRTVLSLECPSSFQFLRFGRFICLISLRCKLHGPKA